VPFLPVPFLPGTLLPKIAPGKVILSHCIFPYYCGGQCESGSCCCRDCSFGTYSVGLSLWVDISFSSS